MDDGETKGEKGAAAGSAAAVTEGMTAAATLLLLLLLLELAFAVLVVALAATSAATSNDVAESFVGAATHTAIGLESGALSVAGSGTTATVSTGAGGEVSEKVGEL